MFVDHYANFIQFCTLMYHYNKNKVNRTQFLVHPVPVCIVPSGPVSVNRISSDLRF